MTSRQVPLPWLHVTQRWVGPAEPRVLYKRSGPVRFGCSLSAAREERDPVIVAVFSLCSVHTGPSEPGRNHGGDGGGMRPDLLQDAGDGCGSDR